MICAIIIDGHRFSMAEVTNNIMSLCEDSDYCFYCALNSFRGVKESLTNE